MKKKRKWLIGSCQYSKHVIYGVVNHSCTIRLRISFIFVSFVCTNFSLLCTLCTLYSCKRVHFFFSSSISFYFWTALNNGCKSSRFFRNCTCSFVVVVIVWYSLLYEICVIMLNIRIKPLRVKLMKCQFEQLLIST